MIVLCSHNIQIFLWWIWRRLFLKIMFFKFCLLMSGGTFIIVISPQTTRGHLFSHFWMSSSVFCITYFVYAHLFCVLLYKFCYLSPLLLSIVYLLENVPAAPHPNPNPWDAATYVALPPSLTITLGWGLHVPCLILQAAAGCTWFIVVILLYFCWCFLA